MLKHLSMSSASTRVLLLFLYGLLSFVTSLGEQELLGGSAHSRNQISAPLLELRRRGACKLDSRALRLPGLRGGEGVSVLGNDSTSDLFDRFSWSMNLSRSTLDGVEHLSVRIRQACVNDVVHLHRMNLICLAENYNSQYFIVSILRCPTLTWIAEVLEEDDVLGIFWRPVGYVFGRTQQPENASVYDLFSHPAADSEVEGQITSLAVLKKYRSLHLGRKLIQRCMTAMKEFYDVRRCCLHVRVSNKAAMKLYCDVFNFQVEGVRSR